MTVWVLIITFASLDPGNGLKKGFWIYEHTVIDNIASEQECHEVARAMRREYTSIQNARCISIKKVKP